MKRMPIAMTIAVGMFVFSPSFAQQEGLLTPFTIVLVGTTHFADVDTVMKALRRSSRIGEIKVSRLSRGAIELSGLFRGDATGLMGEITSATVDRFVLESETSKKGQGLFTFRKLESSTGRPTVSPPDASNNLSQSWEDHD